VNGEFVTIPAPRVPELARLTHAMNTMVTRLRLIFDAQTQQVESLRLQANCDALTGLSNRKHFLGQLAASLQREDGPLDGGLVLLRVVDLAEVNRQIGYEAADRLITTIGQALQTYTERASGCNLGRLNGSDFALYLPVGGVALETGSALVQALRVLLPAFGPHVTVAVGAVEVRRTRTLTQIMGAADAALARAESHGPFSVELDAEPTDSPALRGQDAWRQSIASALVTGRARLVSFPVIDAARQLVHLECPLRLRLDPEGPFEVAARWLPLAVRSRLTPMVDERAVSLALAAMAGDDMPRCVNLCAASLGDPHFAPRLRSLLEQAPREAQRLSLEVPESAAIDHFEWMLELGRQLRPCGVRLGLEHAGERLSHIDHLFEAGLQYVKLDAAVVQGVAGDAGQTDFVRGVVTMLHGLSLQVYAEGVTSAADAEVLWQVGLDGITGPWASTERADWVFGTG
ncbi:MAG: EAL domain-containing protein, partial [Pseudomonadota bacterium]